MDAENKPTNGNTDATPLRLLRPSIVVLCGPAGCGKSTFAKQHFRATQVISSDWARGLICDDEREQRFNTQAFALLHFLLEQRLTLNRLCVVDSTALTAGARRDLLELAKKLHVPTTLILFKVPLEICVERDEKREKSVGRSIIEHQFQAFEESNAAIRQEGFEQVVELAQDDLDKVHIEILFRPVTRPVQRPQRIEGGAPRRSERPTPAANPPGNGSAKSIHDVSTPIASHSVPPADQRSAASTDFPAPPPLVITRSADAANPMQSPPAMQKSAGGASADK